MNSCTPLKRKGRFDVSAQRQKVRRDVSHEDSECHRPARLAKEFVEMHVRSAELYLHAVGPDPCGEEAC